MLKEITAANDLAFITITWQSRKTKEKKQIAEILYGVFLLFLFI